MAVGLYVAEKNLEDSKKEKEVTCTICKENYTDPKILPCLHYYCKQCILNLALKAGKDKPFSCPECHKDTTLPEGGVEELESAFFVKLFNPSYFKVKKALSKQTQCEMCKSEASAEALCKQCDKFACNNCVHIHTELSGLFEGHEIVSIDQLQKMKAEELVPKNPKLSKCQLHNEFLKIFCFDCNELICRDCTIKDHRDHDSQFINVAAGKKKKELMDSLKPLKEMEDSLSGALEEVHNTEHKVEGQGDSVANTIETSFEELHTILETHKQQLLEEARRRVREKMENLKGQEENLSIARAGIRSVIHYTEQCVRHGSDEAVMIKHIQISRRIREEVEEHSKAGNMLEPVEEADMGVEVRCAEDLQRLCQKAKITHHADYIVVNNMPNTVEVDKEIKIEVANTNKKAIESALIPQGQIKCVPTGAVLKLRIEVKTPDRYEISYTPSVRGRHELSISAYGQPVPGSPFTMTVYMSPAQLDKPVKVWSGITNPFSIAVNSVGQIIVAEHYKDIVVLNNEGKIMRRIKQSQLEINKLRSVSVDNEDNIYFIGYNSNKIGKANKNCDILLVQDIQVKQDGIGYLDVAVVGDEVMVTEYYNNGYIMVYDRDFNYVRQIATSNNTKLKYIYPDHHGKLYITANDKTIQVLSMTGDFIRLFSHDHNGVQQLQDPRMAHVCGQYVYVADWSLKKTVVFTTEGDYMTTFGCRGGICVNHDGILYIGDYDNNEVTCYLV